MENAKKTKSEFYIEFLPLISNRSVELLDNKRLRSQFIALERRSRSGGRDQVDNFLGHDDLSNAAAGACVLASQVDSYRLPPPSYGFIEDITLLEKKLEQESIEWLTGVKRKRPKDELDLDELEREMMEDLQNERIRRYSTKGVKLLSGWEDK